jgi:CHAT domain-containing protein
MLLTTDTEPVASVRGPGGYDPASTMPAPGRPRRRTDDLSRELENVQCDYDEALRHLRADFDPDFDPDKPVPPITFADSRALVPDDVPTALVQYSLMRDRGLALVITRDDAFAVPLPVLDANRGWELANAWYRSYYSGDRAAWETALPELLRPVAERAVRPVVEALAGRGLRRLVLAPNKGLHIFPLHACTLADGRYLADALEVVYTPSLSILHRCATRQRARPQHLVLVEDPTNDLPYTRVEGAGLRRLYHDRGVLSGVAAEREALLRDGTGSHVFHYSGHASFDPTDPLRSALVLGSKDPAGREQWLELRQVFTRLHMPQNVLTVLNGCESGMVEPDRVDEYIGLASGFLYAGSTCVLSTLWAVYDLSSALLALRFHELFLKGAAPGAALAEAQRWLRSIASGVQLRDQVLPDLLQRLETDEQRTLCAVATAKYARDFPDRPPFSSPVHWAPFTATGLSYPLARVAPRPT